MKRFILWSVRIFFFLSWLMLFGYFWINHFGWPLVLVTSDVSKRIEAPDHSKTALLIRRNAFPDLNFIVKVISKSGASTLYISPDYIPDPTVDYNEHIQWSKDSSLIIFSTNSIPAGGSAKSWAYDFLNQHAITEPSRIIAVFKERNAK